MCNDKVLDAMTRCLRAYEKLIKNPGKYKTRWSQYGTICSCLVCEAMGNENGVGDQKCIECPINPCCRAESEVSLSALQEAIYWNKNKQIKKAAKARYTHLLDLLYKNGYGYEEVQDD